MLHYTEGMLKDEWIPGVRFANGANVNLKTVSEAIREAANASGIPVDFSEHQLKVGGLFSKQLEDVLIMFNPEHVEDYNQFLIRIQHMGNYAFMHVYNMGGSRNLEKINRIQKGGTLGTITAIGGIIGGAKDKIQAENQYYTILSDILSSL